GVRRTASLTPFADERAGTFSATARHPAGRIPAHFVGAAPAQVVPDAVYGMGWSIPVHVHERRRVGMADDIADQLAGDDRAGPVGRHAADLPARIAERRARRHS